MRGLTGQELLRAWEVGLEQHPLDRALTLLTATQPEARRAELAALTVGQRDALLLGLRERTFGSRLAGVVGCPECRELLEFEFNSTDVQAAPSRDLADRAPQVTEDGWEVTFHLPTSFDLAAAVDCTDANSARSRLAGRCVDSVRCHGEEVSVRDLPETVIVAMAGRMAELDPQAEIGLALDCPDCGHHWTSTFDILTFFWAEVAAQAKRLLCDVHLLARAYGWRETDILAMPVARRQLYLEMLNV